MPKPIVKTNRTHTAPLNPSCDGEFNQLGYFLKWLEWIEARPHINYMQRALIEMVASTLGYIKASKPKSVEDVYTALEATIYKIDEAARTNAPMGRNG